MMLILLFVVRLTVGESKSYADDSKSESAQHQHQRTTELSVSPKTGTTIGRLSGDGTSTNLRSYVKQLGFTEVLCQASNVSHCPVVIGGTEWKLDVNGISPNEIPKGSKWYAVMDGTTIFCNAVMKRNCPTLPGPEAWIMLPADIKIFCRTENVLLCSHSSNRTWHRVASVSTSTTETPNFETAQHPDSFKKANGNSQNANHVVQTEESEPKWTKQFEGATIYCTTKQKDKCPITIKGADWGPVYSTGYRESGFETTIGDVTILCSAQTIDKCPKLSKTTRWRPKRGTNKPQSVDSKNEHGETELIYCNFSNKRNCPKLKGYGSGNDRAYEYIEGQGKLKLEQTETQFLCNNQTSGLCAKLSKITQWQPMPKLSGKPNRSTKCEPNTKNCVANQNNERVCCSLPAEQKLPEIKKFGGTVDRMPESKENAITLKLSKVTHGQLGLETNSEPLGIINKADEKNEIISKKSQGQPAVVGISDTQKHPDDIHNNSKSPPVIKGLGGSVHWKPINSSQPTPNSKSIDGTDNKKILLTNVGKAKIYCVVRGERECPRIEGIMDSWKPNSEPIDHAKFEMLLGETPIFCSADDATQCPALSKTSQWQPTVIGISDTQKHPDDIHNNSKSPPVIKGLGGSVHWKPKYSVQPSPNSKSDDGTDNKKILVTNVGKAKIYCVVRDERECPRIPGMMDSWKPNSGPILLAKFEVLLGETPIFCSAHDATQCPPLSKTS